MTILVHIYKINPFYSYFNELEHLYFGWIYMDFKSIVIPIRVLTHMGKIQVAIFNRGKPIQT